MFTLVEEFGGLLHAKFKHTKSNDYKGTCALVLSVVALLLYKLWV
jgi:hypothetical protein